MAYWVVACIGFDFAGCWTHTSDTTLSNIWGILWTHSLYYLEKTIPQRIRRLFLDCIAHLPDFGTSGERNKGSCCNKVHEQRILPQHLSTERPSNRKFSVIDRSSPTKCLHGYFSRVILKTRSRRSLQLADLQSPSAHSRLPSKVQKTSQGSKLTGRGLFHGEMDDDTYQLHRMSHHFANVEEESFSRGSTEKASLASKLMKEVQ